MDARAVQVKEKIISTDIFEFNSNVNIPKIRNNGSNFKNNGNNIVRDFWTESVDIFGSKIPQ